MKTRNFFHPVLLLFTAILLSINACVSPQDMIEAGDYDLAIYKSLKKLKGKKKKKQEFVTAVEEAFRKATDKDMRMIERLKGDGLDANWVEINKVHKRIRKRQELLEPYLPLIDRKGLKAEFRFVKIDELERESRNKAAAYHYDKAVQLLVEARQGDRQSARSAYAQLNKIDDYFRDYKNKKSLLNEALNLGQTHIAFKIANDAGVILPADFERELLNIGVGDLNSRWKTFHLKPTEGEDYDYQLMVRLTNIDVSPEFVKEREYVDVKEIEDGFDYVLDSNGNVLKDTLGNDVTIPRKAFIQAQVFETFQNKFARIKGDIEFVDVRTRNLVRSDAIYIEALFENYASTFRGDRRALSRASKNRIGNRPVPFPADEELLLQAADELKPVLREKMSYYRSI